MYFKKILFSILALCAVSCMVSYADTIYTKEGKEMKGIVVEDYTDRLIFSTIDGEITVMKPDVRELYYDSEEDNLLKLAEQSRERKKILSGHSSITTRPSS